MKERGVLGGSMFGITFFQASTKLESAVGLEGRSVENGRAVALAEDRYDRAMWPVARRNIVSDGWGRSALAGSEGEGSGAVGDFEEVRRWLATQTLSVFWLGFVLVGSYG